GGPVRPGRSCPPRARAPGGPAAAPIAWQTALSHRAGTGSVGIMRELMVWRGLRWPRTEHNPKPPSSPTRRWLRVFLIAVGVLTLLTGVTLGVAVLWALMILPRSLPAVSALETFQPVLGTKIYDDNDELITELHAERRIFVPLAEIPQTL